MLSSRRSGSSVTGCPRARMPRNRDSYTRMPPGANSRALPTRLADRAN
jgi:hypothetical protein